MKRSKQAMDQNQLAKHIVDLATDVNNSSDKNLTIRKGSAKRSKQALQEPVAEKKLLRDSN